MFLNEEYLNFFEKNGFVKLKILKEQELEELIELFDRTKEDSGLSERRFFTSIWSDNVYYKRRVDEGIKSILEPAIERELANFKSIFANFMVKNIGDDSQLQPHQDWSFVDEEKDYSITVWVPLCDVDKSNGALEVLPKSHNIQNHIRARFQNSPFQSQIQDIAANKMESISMKKGEALFVNSRTIHGSPPNLSLKQRLVASVVITSKSASLLHFVQDKEDNTRAHKLEVNPDFYIKYSCFDYPEMDSNGIKVDLSLEEVLL